MAPGGGFQAHAFVEGPAAHLGQVRLACQPFGLGQGGAGHVPVAGQAVQHGPAQLRLGVKGRVVGRPGHGAAERFGGRLGVPAQQVAEALDVGRQAGQAHEAMAFGLGARRGGLGQGLSPELHAARVLGVEAPGLVHRHVGQVAARHDLAAHVAVGLGQGQALGEGLAGRLPLLQHGQQGALGAERTASAFAVRAGLREAQGAGHPGQATLGVAQHAQRKGQAGVEPFEAVGPGADFQLGQRGHGALQGCWELPLLHEADGVQGVEQSQGLRVSGFGRGQLGQVLTEARGRGGHVGLGQGQGLGAGVAQGHRHGWGSVQAALPGARSTILAQRSLPAPSSCCKRSNQASTWASLGSPWAPRKCISRSRS